MVSRTDVKHKGFTLIELLVVIAIIAILAAILFPVFARARENARRASCQSNMKQIGLGFMQYTQDYDEKLPFMTIGDSYTANTAATWLPGSLGWPLSLQPYLKSRQILVCPSDTDKACFSRPAFETQLVEAGIPGASLTMTAAERAAALPLSYSTNYNLDKNNNNISAFAASAKLLLFTETTATIPGGALSDTTNIGVYYTVPGYSGNRWVGGARHLEGRNIAFADGHVKWFVNTGVAATEAAWVGRGVNSFANQE